MLVCAKCGFFYSIAIIGLLQMNANLFRKAATVPAGIAVEGALAIVTDGRVDVGGLGLLSGESYLAALS
jgi:hypothetical protein